MNLFERNIEPIKELFRLLVISIETRDDPGEPIYNHDTWYSTRAFNNKPFELYIKDEHVPSMIHMELRIEGVFVEYMNPIYLN